MQFRTRIPDASTPSGILLVQTDQGHNSLRVLLPHNGKPGDFILFEIPDGGDVMEEPLIAKLDTTERWSILMRCCCCCCFWCCPDGIEVSEWALAFFTGLWIGLAIMFGFALGALSISPHQEEPEL